MTRQRPLPGPHAIRMEFSILAELSPSLADAWRSQYGECEVVLLRATAFDDLQKLPQIVAEHRTEVL